MLNKYNAKTYNTSTKFFIITVDFFYLTFRTFYSRPFFRINKYSCQMENDDFVVTFLSLFSPQKNEKTFSSTNLFLYILVFWTTFKNVTILNNLGCNCKL